MMGLKEGAGGEEEGRADVATTLPAVQMSGVSQ